MPDVTEASASRIRAGDSSRLGARWDGKGTNFALFSAHATRVELCLFDSTGAKELERIALPEKTGDVWHGYIPDIHQGALYGYRVHGPYDPRAGHRFNSNKLLLDPYARGHIGALAWRPECFGYQLEGGDDLSFDVRDSAPFVPKCLVTLDEFDWRGQPRSSGVPWDRTVIYEMHVKGFTKRHPGLPAHLQGTFAGLATSDVVAYVKSLGITSVELLPVHTSASEGRLLEKGLSNYWGYNTLAFFAPDPRYESAQGEAPREFKAMVAALHDAGLEVILDVVYNHTAEGDEKGPTLSFKGIDNLSYYRLLPEDKRRYANNTCTGNTLNVAHPHVLAMVLDSLRYWAQEMRVDGFRFDLGTIVSQGANGFDSHSDFLKVCGNDPILSSVKMIAEPWDCGPDGYQVGGFPPPWGEWNDRYRNSVRSFWKGNAAASDIVQHLCASEEIFNRPGRHPWASINFVTSHDGFTMNDIVTYNDKHNEANGDNNRDGSADNRSWNCGVEGETQDPAINALRERQTRNMLATLLFSQGTPHVLAGDERYRSQNGNNNAYCQDNEISWLNWDFKDREQSLIRFFQRLCSLRNQYSNLRCTQFLTGAPKDGSNSKPVSWINATGAEIGGSEWHDTNMRCFGMLIDEDPARRSTSPTGDAAAVLLVLNAHYEIVDFVLPDCPRGTMWARLLDTDTALDESDYHRKVRDKYPLNGRSLAVFAGTP
jgi:glycogen operon protein